MPGEAEALLEELVRGLSRSDGGSSARDVSVPRRPGTAGGRHGAFRVAGTAVHAVAGPAETLFLFAKEREVVALSVAPGLARPTLADLLSVPPESLPDAVTPDGVALLPPPESIYRAGRPGSVARVPSR